MKKFCIRLPLAWLVEKRGQSVKDLRSTVAGLARQTRSLTSEALGGDGAAAGSSSASGSGSYLPPDLTAELHSEPLLRCSPCAKPCGICAHSQKVRGVLLSEEMLLSEEEYQRLLEADAERYSQDRHIIEQDVQRLQFEPKVMHVLCAYARCPENSGYVQDMVFCAQT